MQLPCPGKRPLYNLTRLVLRVPALSAVVLAAATAFLLAGLPNVHRVFSIREILGGNHPTIRTLEGFVESYGGGFPALIAWS